MRPKELSREKETEREIFLHQNKNILFVTTLLRGLNDKQQTKKIFASHISDKKLVSRIHNKLSKLRKETDNSVFKNNRQMNTHFTKRI